MMTIDQRIDLARSLKERGYNCSQCVVMAFHDITGLDDDQASRLAAGFGGGFAGQGSLCGALTAMAMVDGFIRWHKPADKALVYRDVKLLTQGFAERNEGCILCSDLKQRGHKPCLELIIDAVEALDRHIHSQPTAD